MTMAGATSRSTGAMYNGCIDVQSGFFMPVTSNTVRHAFA
jgi:hypothetical protein